MKINPFISILFFLFFTTSILAQDTLLIDPQAVVAEEPRYDEIYDPLSPARAAFYSAVLPGLGQAYNNNYWKVPIVYTALGVGVYFYLANDRQYDRYRTAYKQRLAGDPDEFLNENGNPILSDAALIDAQKFYQRNKEISILVTAGIYALNIIDANVDAHLEGFNVDEDLTLKPSVNFDQVTGTMDYGVSLNYRM